MLTTRIALALVGLTALLALVRGGTDGGTREDLAALSERVSTLDASLADERQARARLEGELGRLRAELALQRAAPARAPTAASPPPPPESEPPPASQDPRADEPQPLAFAREVLLGAGFSPSEVERFRERVSAIELERLYLRDEARREGWLASPRFAAESGRLDRELASLRAEPDEDLYDWMLYAEGRPNRVAVTEVLPGSAAESVGLQPGDLIVRYDESLVLSAGELLRATSAGTAGASVELEVQRGGELQRVFLPRGPIGIRLEPRSVAPAPRG